MKQGIIRPSRYILSEAKAFNMPVKKQKGDVMRATKRDIYKMTRGAKTKMILDYVDELMHKYHIDSAYDGNVNLIQLIAYTVDLENIEEYTYKPSISVKLPDENSCEIVIKFMIRKTGVVDDVNMFNYTERKALHVDLDKTITRLYDLVTIIEDAVSENFAMKTVVKCQQIGLGIYYKHNKFRTDTIFYNIPPAWEIGDMLDGDDYDNINEYTFLDDKYVKFYKFPYFHISTPLTAVPTLIFKSCKDVIALREMLEKHLAKFDASNRYNDFSTINSFYVAIEEPNPNAARYIIDELVKKRLPLNILGVDFRGEWKARLTDISWIKKIGKRNWKEAIYSLKEMMKDTSEHPYYEIATNGAILKSDVMAFGKDPTNSKYEFVYDMTNGKAYVYKEDPDFEEIDHSLTEAFKMPVKAQHIPSGDDSERNITITKNDIDKVTFGNNKKTIIRAIDVELSNYMYSTGILNSLPMYQEFPFKLFGIICEDINEGMPNKFYNYNVSVGKCADITYKDGKILVVLKLGFANDSIITDIEFNHVFKVFYDMLSVVESKIKELPISDITIKYDLYAVPDQGVYEYSTGNFPLICIYKKSFLRFQNDLTLVNFPCANAKERLSQQVYKIKIEDESTLKDFSDFVTHKILHPNTYDKFYLSINLKMKNLPDANEIDKNLPLNFYGIYIEPGVSINTVLSYINKLCHVDNPEIIFNFGALARLTNKGNDAKLLATYEAATNGMINYDYIRKLKIKQSKFCKPFVQIRYSPNEGKLRAQDGRDLTNI
jgi:hypothetical protein